MAYVQRDAKGEVCAVSEYAQSGFEEKIAPGDPQLRQFLEALDSDRDMKRTDLEFVRVLEDLIDVLIDKNVLLFTELPERAQAKILKRQALRRGESSLDLIDDDPPV